MNLSIPSHILREAIKATNLPAKSFLPSSGSVRINASPESTTITNANGEQIISVSVQAEVSEPGSFCINQRSLASIQGGGDVQIIIDGTRAKVISGGMKLTLPVLPGTEMPDYPEAGSERLGLADAGLSAMVKDLEWVATPVSSKCIHDYGKGLCVKDGVIFGANGRIANVLFERLGTINEIVIPSEAIKPILAILVEEDSMMELYQGVLVVTGGGTRLTTTLIHTQIPPIELLIPAQLANPSITCDTESLSGAIESVRSATGAETVSMSPSEDGILVTCSNGGVSASVAIPGDIVAEVNVHPVWFNWLLGAVGDGVYVTDRFQAFARGGNRCSVLSLKRG